MRIVDALIGDHLRMGTSGGEHLAAWFREFLVQQPRDMQVFRIDNVASYYWQKAVSGETIREVHAAHQYPNVAPSFPLMFFEWQVPRVVREQSAERQADYREAEAIIGNKVWVPASQALVVFAGDMTNQEDRQNWLAGGNPNLSFWAERHPDVVGVVRWICLGYPLAMDSTGTGLSVPLVVAWGVKEDGTFVTDPDDGETLLSWQVFSAAYEKLYVSNKREYFTQVATVILRTCSPAWLALSFLHCKNVLRTEVTPSAKLNKARVRRGKPPFTQYYTLEIEPMRKVLREEGHIERFGLNGRVNLRNDSHVK